MSIVLNDEKFNSLYQETVLELFFSNWYNTVIKNVEFCLDAPLYFYRYNERPDTLILKSSFSINEDFSLTISQKDFLLSFIAAVSDNNNFIKLELLRLIPEWSNFISISDYSTGSLEWVFGPEDIEITQEILSFFSKYSENLFVKEAHLLVSYKLKDYTLSWKLFQSIIAIDPGNPFILLRYARFLWSVCYKQSLNIEFIESAISYIKLAITNLGPTISNFTFCYAWIWQLYHAVSNYDEAIFWYNKTITLNESQWFYKEEWYIWTANAMTGLGRYTESISIYENIFKTKLAKKHSIDFRNFKVMAINYWYIYEFIKFRHFFLKSLNFFLISEQGHITITLGNEKLLLSDIKNFLDRNSILQNDFNSFQEYYFQYLRDLQNNSWMIILQLWWLFLKFESSTLNIWFHNSRWLEKLCFYYLQTFLYEKKWIWK